MAGKMETCFKVRTDISFDLTQTQLKCNGDLFPTIKMLPAILLALPVSTATAERSVSTLKC